MSFFKDEQDESKLGADLTNALGTEDTTEETPKPEETEVETIKLGETEYTRDELDSLVGLGQKAQEIEKNHGDFDKYVSEFGRKSAKIGELNKELDGLKSKPETENELAGDSLKEAQEAARKLGIPLTEDVKTMVQEIMNESFSSKYSEVRAGEKLVESVQGLEKEISGDDGRPKFESGKVLDFMKENPGFKTPKQAYEAMHPDQMAQWRVDQILKGKKGGIVTQTNTQPAKAPVQPGVNNSNLHQMLAEQLNK